MLISCGNTRELFGGFTSGIHAQLVVPLVSLPALAGLIISSGLVLSVHLFVGFRITNEAHCACAAPSNKTIARVLASS